MQGCQATHQLRLAHCQLAHVRKRAVTARALCGEEAQHARLPRARATPRELVLAIRLKKAAMLATGLCSSMQGCGATRWPWPHALPACACAQESGHRTRSVLGESAANAFAARARHTARVGFGHPTLEGRRAGDRALLFGFKPRWHAPTLASHAAGISMCARDRSPHVLFVGRKRIGRVCQASAPRHTD